MSISPPAKPYMHPYDKAILEKERVRTWIKRSKPGKKPVFRIYKGWTWDISGGCAGCDECIEPPRWSLNRLRLWLARRLCGWAFGVIGSVESEGLKVVRELTEGKSTSSNRAEIEGLLKEEGQQ